MEKRIPKIETPFINLQSDYGFKRTFGTERFQLSVIKLLDAALGDELTVTQIKPRREYLHPEYQNKEILPNEKAGKRIVYDVYFKLKVQPGNSSLKPAHLLKQENPEVEHHFILEMQNAYEPPFEDRMLYYASRIMADQGKSGWNYDMDPVILIAVTDFDFPHLKSRMVQDFELREKTTGEILTKKLRMLFYSLKQLPTKWEECETELQKRLFLIKNMDKLDKNSKPYLEGGYEDMFDAAESAQLVEEEAVAYSQSLSRLRSHQAGLEYQYNEGRSEGRLEGLLEGRREGRQEGLLEGKIEFAKNLIKMGFGTDIIAKASGLSPETLTTL